jgi:hypothetical protein
MSIPGISGLTAADRRRASDLVDATLRDDVARLEAVLEEVAAADEWHLALAGLLGWVIDFMVGLAALGVVFDAPNPLRNNGEAERS